MTTPPDAFVDPAGPEKAPDWEGEGWTPFTRVNTATSAETPAPPIALPSQLAAGRRPGRAERRRAQALNDRSEGTDTAVASTGPQAPAATGVPSPRPNDAQRLVPGPDPHPSNAAAAARINPVRTLPAAPAAAAPPPAPPAAASAEAPVAANAPATKEHRFARPGGRLPAPAEELAATAPPPTVDILPPPPPVKRRRRDKAAAAALPKVGPTGAGSTRLPVNNSRRRGRRGKRVLTIAIALVLVASIAGSLVAVLRMRTNEADSSATGSRHARQTETRPGLLGAPGRTAGKAPLVTPTEAGRVLRTLWNARESAVLHHDTSGIAALEVGVALTNDNAVARCRCGPKRSGTYQDSNLWVTRQTRYPISFGAEVSTLQADAPYTEVLILRRTAATQPWLLVLDTGWGPKSSPRPGMDTVTADSEGYSKEVTSSLHDRAIGAPDALASYWRLAKSTGKVQRTAVFTSGPWTSVLAQGFAKHPDGKRQSNGYPAAFGFLVDPQAGTYVLRTGAGALACSAVGVVAKYTSWPKQDANRQTWGPDVSPGPHRRIVSLETWQTCFRLPASGGAMEVLGGDGSRAPVRLA